MSDAERLETDLVTKFVRGSIDTHNKVPYASTCTVATRKGIYGRIVVGLFRRGRLGGHENMDEGDEKKKKEGPSFESGAADHDY